MAFDGNSNRNDSSINTNDGVIIFKITESISKAGIVEFTLKAYDFEIILTNGRKCCVAFSPQRIIFI